MTLSIALRSPWSAQLSPEDLMTEYAQSGNPRSLARLYDALADDLFHYLCSLTDYHCAKDLAQRTWLRVIDKRHLYRTGGPVKGWLFRIARNLLIDEIRSQAKWIAELPEQAADGPDLANVLDAEAAFDIAMQALPFHQREAIILQQEGFSLSEIADMCGEQQETIKSRLRYARNKLQQVLEAYRD